MSLLSVERLAKAYGGVRALDGVSFALEAGEVVALIGPNGAGKSTCFDLLSGQARPDAGRVVVDGRDATGLGPRAIRRLGVGRTFQTAATFGSMRVRENVQVALLAAAGRLGPFGFGGAAERSEADALCGLVGLAELVGRPSGELAYGDLKRLELATALANEPALLLMDEPTAGMAPTERIALMRLVAAIARERRIGVLFTEHDMDVVFEHADRVMVMDRGLVIATGRPEEVRRDPQVRATYLGEGLVFANGAAA